MAKPFIKLDYDWREDPKVMLYEKRYKKAALVDLVTMFVLMADCGGYVDSTDEGHMLKACKALGMGEDGVLKVFGRMIDCGLADKGAWERSGIVCSRRSIAAFESADRRRESALEASKAAAEKRRAKTASDDRDGTV